MMLWACAQCGCTDVQETAWIEMNGGMLLGDEGPTEQHWCPQCEEDDVPVDEIETEPRPYPFCLACLRPEKFCEADPCLAIVQGSLIVIAPDSDFWCVQGAPV